MIKCGDVVMCEGTARTQQSTQELPNTNSVIPRFVDEGKANSKLPQKQVNKFSG